MVGTLLKRTSDFTKGQAGISTITDPATVAAKLPEKTLLERGGLRY